MLQVAAISNPLLTQNITNYSSPVNCLALKSNVARIVNLTGCQLGASHSHWRKWVGRYRLEIRLASDGLVTGYTATRCYTTYYSFSWFDGTCEMNRTK